MLSKNEPVPLTECRWQREIVGMMIHDARVPEKTMLDLPPVVLPERAGGSLPARL
jgi:hypothetical protein